MKRLLFFVLVMALVVFWKWEKVAMLGRQLVERLSNRQEQAVSWALTEEDVLGQINHYRTENKTMALRRNEKLNRAALARLRVISIDGDFGGEKTGLTLANAVKNNGYNYSLVGDFWAENVSRETNLVDEWLSDHEAKKTLVDGRLRDVGVAIERAGFNFKMMIILARAAEVRVERVGAGGYSVVSWGGMELWAAVNKRRVERGVGALSQKAELCTIAAIRLNQLLELDKLDGHAGFEPLLNREDLKWVREKYNISEFLIVGYPTAEESVNAWENTLGHKQLLSGGEYVWGCIYAQNTFGVAIAAY